MSNWIQMKKVGLRNNRKEDRKPRTQRSMAEGSRLEKIMLKVSIRGEQRVKEFGLSLVGTAAGLGGGSKARPLFHDAGSWQAGHRQARWRAMLS